MGRPPLAVGSYGEISYRNLGPKKIRAMAKVHDADGATRQVTRLGTSRQDARSNLLKAIESRAGFTGSTIGPDSTVAEAAKVWLADIDRRVAEGSRAPNTGRVYHSTVKEHVVPGVGALRLREATVPLLDAFIVGMRAHHGAAVTKTSRTVLNGLMGYALRQGAISVNPMAGVSRIAGPRKRRVARALTAVERETWLARLEADEVAVRHDLPDLTRVLLATGVRIGECLALTFADIDMGNKTVAIDHTITPVKGRGLLRMPTKTSAGERTLALPGWAVDVLIRRGDALGWRGPVFPSVASRGNGNRAGGGWRDPSNTARSFRDARDRAGFGWITSHVFRKTVATVMDEAGLTGRDVADQLGHAKVSMTQDVYMGRKVAGRGAAIALADMFDEKVE